MKNFRFLFFITVFISICVGLWALGYDMDAITGASVKGDFVPKTNPEKKAKKSKKNSKDNKKTKSDDVAEADDVAETTTTIATEGNRRYVQNWQPSSPTTTTSSTTTTVKSTTTTTTVQNVNNDIWASLFDVPETTTTTSSTTTTTLKKVVITTTTLPNDDIWASLFGPAETTTTSSTTTTTTTTTVAPVVTTTTTTVATDDIWASIFGGATTTTSSTTTTTTTTTTVAPVETTTTTTVATDDIWASIFGGATTTTSSTTTTSTTTTTTVAPVETTTTTTVATDDIWASIFGGATTTTSSTTTTTTTSSTTTTSTTTTTVVPVVTTTTTSTTVYIPSEQGVVVFIPATTTTTTIAVIQNDMSQMTMYYYHPQGITTDSETIDDENGPYIPQYSSSTGKNYENPEVPDIKYSGKNSEEETDDKESNFIRFKDTDNIPTSSEYDYKSELNGDNYSEQSFIPKTATEFEKVNPKFSYTSNNVVKSGMYQIKNNLGLSMFDKGVVAMRNNNFKNSETIFNKLVYYNYNCSECYYYLSTIANLKKDYSLAVEIMKVGLERAEENSDVSKYLYQIGSIYYTMGSYNQSLMYLNQALSKVTNGEGAYMYNTIGLCYMKLDDYKNAIKYWKLGISKGDSQCKASYQWLLTKSKSK